MFGDRFETLSGVLAHLEQQGIKADESAVCGRCKKRNRPAYGWPLPGFGSRCAVCIMIESQQEGA